MSVRSTFVRSFIVVAVITLISSAFALLITHPAAATLPPPPPQRANDLDRLPRLPDALMPDTGAQSVQAVNVSPWYRVAFQSARDDNWEIYFGNDDGSGQTRLTNNGDSDIQPRLNRGATRIVFASRRTGNYDIYTMNVDGSGVTRLTTSSGDDLLPYWSPDGSRIVFQSTRDGQAEVYVMNANGSGQTRLTFNSDYDGEAAWSPDGTRIAFVSKRTSGTTDYWLWTMNADGSNQQLLANQPYCGHPVWSPSGTRLAYDASGGDYWQNLWIVNADGSNAHQVLDEYGQMDTWAGSWSPNEQYIAITRIYYIYYQGQWYWTEAYVDGFDPVMGFTVRLSPSNTDWRPDWQSLDITPPTASLGVPAAPARSPIGVTWSATDAQSGVGTYDVQVKDGAGGSWTDWQSATTATSAQYAGIGGHTYYFRVRARDQSGNVAAWSAAPQANTTVEALPPTSSVSALPAFVKNQVTLQWNGSDPGGSGIETFDVQYRDGVNGVWTGWLTGTLNLTTTFYGDSGHTYFFRARAIDKARNLEGWPTGDGDASTQFYAWAISGLAKDNTGTPISGLNVTTVPAAQATFTDDPAGLYTAYVMSGAQTYTTTWSKNGYGDLPTTAFSGGYAQSPNPRQGVLPAQDNGGPAIVSISNLIPGQRYRIVISGIYEYTYGIPADAQWAWAAPGCFCSYSRMINFNGELLPAEDHQAAAASDHTYTFFWTATASELWLHINDSTYSDNSGQLHFEIASGIDDAQMDLVLPPSNNAVLNGDFEAATLESWTMSGELTPTLTTSVQHTGQRSVLLGVMSTPSAGNSRLSQAITVPLESPVLSFMYQPKTVQSTLLNDLVAYWPLDEASGTRADVTGRGNDLQDHNGVGAITGKIGAAASFSPTLQNYLSHADNADLSTGDVDFTVAGWTYLYSPTSSGSILGKGNTNAYNTLEYSMGYNSGADRFGAVLGNATTGSYLEASAFGGVNAGQWYFVIMWHDATRRQVGIAVNGLENSGGYSGGVWDTPYEFRVGDTLTNVIWNGAVDEVGIWKRVLSSEERTTLYNEGQGCTYPFLACTSVSRRPAFAPQADLGFAVEVYDAFTTTTLLSETLATQDWTHRWFDLSNWAGQTITVNFQVSQEDTGTSQGAIYLDEVSVGSAMPDVWVQAGVPATSLRATSIVYQLTLGNQGGAPANGVMLTATLPADVTFVDASLPPVSASPVLTWNLGDFTAKNTPTTLLITATIAATATNFSTLTADFEIGTTTVELEQANNVAQAETFVGLKVFLPVMQRQ